jgi:hypothetical protein
MTDRASLACRIDQRRRRLFDNPDWNGIDYLDVADDQMSLCVHFFGGIPEGITTDNVRIDGGRRIRDIKAVHVALDPSHDEEIDDCLKITLDRPGDFSTYTLCLAGVPHIDPRFACLDFSFKTNCPSDLDCGDKPVCPPEPRAEPDINYLAKDYASFRQLIRDRLALTLPGWDERHVPDLGVTLVELLAYAGDYLSYYQDAVATEAYLDTARLRISVRRHLRLIDYAMHEGCNARAFVTVATDTDFEIAGGGAYFLTRSDAIPAKGGGFVTEAALANVTDRNYLVFEPLAAGPLAFRAAHNRIVFHDWGDGECCLPSGSTSATLVDHAGEPDPQAEAHLALQAGDYLIFEEVLGARTGNSADADPAHRHPVRLTRVTRGYDALLETLVQEIEWAGADALPFALCLSARRSSPDCGWIREISVACGNVVPIDHGATATQPLDPVEGADIAGDCACDGSVIEVGRRALAYAPVLDRVPLTFAEPAGQAASAAALMTRDPRAAQPAIRLNDAGSTWLPALDLLSSGSEDRGFVVEIDDEGHAHLRFGDGVHGHCPDLGSAPVAAYRSGNGAIGNVGRDAIGLLVLRGETLNGPTIAVRNPLAACGGTDPEPVAEARLFAPEMILARRERAIIAEDYAELAMRDQQLQGAAAKLRWTGSWHEARVAIDSMGREDASRRQIAQVAESLQRYRRIGHDLAVTAARLVPLRLAVHVCVLPHFDRAHIEAELLDIFSNRRRADGSYGFFHPDNWRFGQSVALSRIVAAAMAVEGIQTVAVTTLQRLNGPDGDRAALDSGLLAVRPGEIIQLDNDPDYPENGKLEFDMGGGQ